MFKLNWDEVGKRLYETGVDRAVLYILDDKSDYSKGVVWNGVTAINEKPSGAEAEALYADGIKYVNLISNEEFAATIEAVMYPDEFAECDGSVEVAPGIYAGQQNRKQFGLAYRTILGNDTKLNDYGYKLHLVYGCLAAPTERGHATITEKSESMKMSWEVKTTPVAITEEIKGKKIKPTAVLTFDSTKVDQAFLEKLEGILYGKAPSKPDGKDGAEARLPLPDEIITMLTSKSGSAANAGNGESQTEEAAVS